jgi:hypothetical protein
MGSNPREVPISASQEQICHADLVTASHWRDGWLSLLISSRQYRSTEMVRTLPGSTAMARVSAAARFAVEAQRTIQAATEVLPPLLTKDGRALPPKVNWLLSILAIRPDLSRAVSRPAPRRPASRSCRLVRRNLLDLRRQHVFGRF